MLSKLDIYQELGNGINIVPLRPENIKENSINVSISQYAWLNADATVCWCGDEEFHLEGRVPTGKKVQHRYTFRKGARAIFELRDRSSKTTKEFLILLPHQTTVVETLEVIGLGERIGGAVHSKVGIVAKGIGDTGTMLGPGYCGHLMLSLHNITDDVIALHVESTVVSLTFDYLSSPVQRTSATSSSHHDRLLQAGFALTEEDNNHFTADWKTNLSDLRKRTKESPEYKVIRSAKWKTIGEIAREWLSPKRLLGVLSFCAVIVLLGFMAVWADKVTNSATWEDRYWTLVIGGVLCYFIPAILSRIRRL